MPYFSRGSLRETVVQNGRVIHDVDADSYSQGDKKHNDFIIRGHDNNMPFLITNMMRSTRKMSNIRAPTPYQIRRKTGKRKTGKRKTGKKKTGKGYE
jgi:hypothetical protein